MADEFLYSMNCHCSNCRRTTGSAFKPLAGIEIEKLNVVEGIEQLLNYGDEAARDVHCSQCGSLLYSVVRDGHFAHVPLGVIDGDMSIRPTHHIFVGSKAPWFKITDNLPQHEEFD
ncbi:MAG: GFA family protein [bacterium]